MKCFRCDIKMICPTCGHLSHGEKTAESLKQRASWGGNIGRPREFSYEQIRELRELGLSWSAISKKIGCSRSTARSAIETGPQPGLQEKK